MLHYDPSVGAIDRAAEVVRGQAIRRVLYSVRYRYTAVLTPFGLTAPNRVEVTAILSSKNSELCNQQNEARPCDTTTDRSSAYSVL